MKLLNIESKDTSLPCEVCTKLANHRLYIMDKGIKYHLYLCENHFMSSYDRLQGVKSIMERREESEEIKDFVYKNVKFKTYFDSSYRIVHILDNSGDKPFTTVTNGIDRILPTIKRVYKLEDDYTTFLYGTDAIISEYNPKGKEFKYVSHENKYVFDTFKEEMLSLYMS